MCVCVTVERNYRLTPQITTTDEDFYVSQSFLLQPLLNSVTFCSSLFHLTTQLLSVLMGECGEVEEGDKAGMLVEEQ